MMESRTSRSVPAYTYIGDAGDDVLSVTYAILNGMDGEPGLFPDGASYRSACILAEKAYFADKVPGEMPRLSGLTQKQTNAVDLALKAARERECAVIH